MFFQGGDNLSKSKIFLVACLVFIAGIGLASYAPQKFFYYEIWWFSAAVFFIILTFLFRRLAIWFFLTAILFFAFWRYGASLPTDTLDKIWYYNNQTVITSGFIANEPDIRDTSQKLEIQVEEIDKMPGKKISGKILITTNLYPEYDYGDRLEIACELQKPEEFKGFAYDRYLGRFNIYSVCYYPKIKVIGSGGNQFLKKVFALKKFLSGLIDAGMSEPESSLARPIVFGGSKGLEQKIRNDFQTTGLTHIMAVSGFNVSILAAVVMAVLLAAGMNRQQAFYLAAAVLGIYVILVGMPASATRAGLMGFLVLWALKLGRLNKITNSLVLAAAILLAFNPKLLRDDAGFQLSFTAITGLIYAYPILQALYEKTGLPKLKGVSDALLITLAAQVFTLPILAYNFSQISLISPLANLAVLWAVPMLTILILAALPLAALLPGLSFIFFLPSLVLAKYILFMVSLMAKIPYASFEVGELSRVWVAIYYAVAVWAVVKAQGLLKD